ncbi:MAG: glycosyltransferase [Acidobacteriota bacterium]|nr:glycosyltransferase [Acidobacteriota bacterium]
MDLSVVIVNWNSGNHLGCLLDSLSPLQEKLREIWVVDNASQDSSADILINYPDVESLFLQENLGFAGAANQGIARSNSCFILLLNPDIQIISESVSQLYQEMVSRIRAGIVCGSLKDRNGKSQNSFQIRPLPTWKNILSDVLFIDELQDWVFGNSQLNPSYEHTQKLVSEQPAAAAWLLRKKAWGELGGFDTRFYPAWFEDVDFCKRMQDSDWEIFYFPHLPMIHRGGLALECLSYPTFVRIFYTNLLKYLKKHHPYFYPMLWIPVQCGMWMRRLFCADDRSV